MAFDRRKTGRQLSAVLCAGIAGAALTFGLGSVAQAASSSSAATPSIDDFTRTQSDNSNWIINAKNYDNSRYVDLDQITPANVSQLKPVWSFQISDNSPIESAPIIWNDTAYITSAHDHVYAIDVKTGKQKWEFSDNPHVISFAANRGVALLDGNVYIGTLDGHLIALNAETGQKVFDVVAVADTSNSFFSQAPMPYRNAAGRTLLLENVSNGDWGGIGEVSAFDPKTGKKVWAWQTIPGPGQKGHDTWPGDSWKRGGASVWTQMALDPKTGMLYGNVGNPSPDFNDTIRKGSDLYTDSLVALDISGDKPKLVWHYQFLRNDTHDWDPVMPPLLFTAKFNGRSTQLVATGDKASNFWLLNAQTGKLVERLAVAMQLNQDQKPSLAGNVACPNTNGGVEYNGGSYDPKTNMIYLPSSNECGFYRANKNVLYISGQFYLGGAFPKFVGPNTGQMNAIDMSTGVFAWRNPDKHPMIGGALSTSSGLVFSGKVMGDFVAYDAQSGKELWSYDTGSSILAPPVAFERDGQEFVAVASGTAGNQLLPDTPASNKGSFLTMFALAK